MWAIINDNLVYQVLNFDPQGAFNEGIQTLPVPAILVPWVSEGYTVTADGIAPASLDTFRRQLLDVLADLRWREETKGALVGERRYHTDQASQAKLTAALFMGRLLEEANGANSYEVTWKSKDGFVTLDLAGLTTVALTCGGHVQQAYRREAEITALIMAAADWQAALQAYNANINTGWPA